MGSQTKIDAGVEVALIEEHFRNAIHNQIA
jgi:hypothetical protein